MTQTNLIDAIKMVQDNFLNFTDMQLKKFSDALQEEIEERKAANNYNPGTSARADNAGKKETKEKKES